MEWRWVEFGNLVWLGEAFEPEKSAASGRPREEEKQATGNLHPRTVPVFKRKKAGANGSVVHITHDVLATIPFVTRHVDARS
jgi:hypothetical protein